MHIERVGDRLKIYVTRADMLRRGAASTDTLSGYFYLDKGGLARFPKKVDTHQFKTILSTRIFDKLIDEGIALAKSQYPQYDFHRIAAELRGSDQFRAVRAVQNDHA